MIITYKFNIIIIIIITIKITKYEHLRYKNMIQYGFMTKLMLNEKYSIVFGFKLGKLISPLVYRLKT